MFADTLLLLERAHIARLLLWGATGVLAGTALLALLAFRRDRSALLRHFGIQMLVWGAVELAIAGASSRSLAMRDLSAASRLDRLLWLNVGLDLGYVGIGATLAMAGWLLGRRLAPLGAGIAIVVQGLALLALNLLLLVRIDGAV